MTLKGFPVCTTTSTKALSSKAWWHGKREPLPRAEDKGGGDLAVDGDGLAPLFSKRLGEEDALVEHVPLEIAAFWSYLICNHKLKSARNRSYRDGISSHHGPAHV